MGCSNASSLKVISRICVSRTKGVWLSVSWPNLRITEFLHYSCTPLDIKESQGPVHVCKYGLVLFYYGPRPIMKPNWRRLRPEHKLPLSFPISSSSSSHNSAQKPWRGKALRPISWTACRCFYSDTILFHPPRPDPPPDRPSTGSRTLLDTPGSPMGPPLSWSFLTCLNLPLSPETRPPSALYSGKCSSSLTTSLLSRGHPKE